MALPTLETRRTVATVVLRPIDALAQALARPPAERGPLGRVRFRVAGAVVGGAVRPLWREPRSVVNLSGDTVLPDFALPAATYRLELVRDGRAAHAYEDLDPAQRDLVWDPAAPGSGLPQLPAHPSRLVVLSLRPAGAYPFPPGSTLVRGSLRWYDGNALAGAVAQAAAAVLPDSRVGPLGDFVLAPRATASAGVLQVGLNLAGVDAASRPQGATYLAAWPAAWPAPWERGAARSIRQGALAGQVRLADGRPLARATVQLAGRPGTLSTDGSGSWSYHFPPLTPAGTADITVTHPGHAAVTLSNIGFPADATAAAPVVVMS